MKQENIIYDIPKLGFFLKTIKAGMNSNMRGVHFHKAVELVRVLEGEILCRIEEDELALGKDDIILINSSTVHQLMCKSHAVVTYLQINLEKYTEQTTAYGSYLDKFIKSNTAEKFAIMHGQNELSSVFEKIKIEFEEKKFCYNEYIKAHIYALVAFMRRNYLLSDVSILCDSGRLFELAPVVEHIDNNFHTKLSLDELAAIIKSDRFRLCRLFKAATNATLFEYINFVRLLSAEEMLLQSQKNIGEIAFECGFASIQYFNRVFKESRGYTPGVFKKMFSE